MDRRQRIINRETVYTHRGIPRPTATRTVRAWTRSGGSEGGGTGVMGYNCRKQCEDSASLPHFSPSSCRSTAEMRLAPVFTGFARLTFFHLAAGSLEFRWNAVAERRR